MSVLGSTASSCDEAHFIDFDRGQLLDLELLKSAAGFAVSNIEKENERNTGHKRHGDGVGD